MTGVQTCALPIYSEHNDEDRPSQQAALSDTIPTNTNRLNLINRLIPLKWFSKVKIVVFYDYEFNVISMIYSRADMNCIQEGIISSKYYEKSTKKRFSANGTQMKIKYELNNAHVCHVNVCFKIPTVLVTNMTDKVIHINLANKYKFFLLLSSSPIISKLIKNFNLITIQILRIMINVNIEF